MPDTDVPIPLATPRPETWIRTTPAGLYCEPGDFYIDPSQPVPRAVVTHGHGDHARPGNGAVLATRETIAIMQARYGEGAGTALQTLAYDEILTIGAVTLRLSPAGHILGSAQIVLDYRGSRVVVSGGRPGVREGDGGLRRAISAGPPGGGQGGLGVTGCRAGP